MTPVVKGRLTYLDWDRPWLVGEADIRPAFWQVAAALKDKPGRHDLSLLKTGSYVLRADPASEFNVEYEKEGAGIGLFMTEGRFGFSNIAAYLISALCAMNGREVIVEVGDDSFSIESVPGENVHGVYYTEDNFAGVSNADALRVCQPGTENCCLFLVMSGDQGWQCAKFSGMTCRSLLARKAEGSIRAQRIGDCTILGRKEKAA